MIKTALLRAMAKFAISALESLKPKTEKEKEEILDICNKVSEVSWIVASSIKGNNWNSYNKNIIAKQLKGWSKGEPTSIDFKTIYR